MDNKEIKRHALEAYLKKRHISKVGFADDIGITPIALNNMIRGHKKPSLPIAVMIERYTLGEIACSSWVDLEEFAEKKEEQKQKRISKKGSKL